MQRPSLALAVLLAAMASGLMLVNVAQCEIIIVFHEIEAVDTCPIAEPTEADQLENENLPNTTRIGKANRHE